MWKTRAEEFAGLFRKKGIILNFFQVLRNIEASFSFERTSAVGLP